MKNIFNLIICFFLTNCLNSQCLINPNNIDTLNLGVDQYFVVRENKSWAAADSCAASFGFQLAKIDTQFEQDTIFGFINSLAINNSNTTAPDGGGAAYVWLGGNDRSTEGNWVWQTRQASQPQFWQGARNGSVVGGLYNNWGNEPDNFNNQDGLGLALSNWPFGVAGEWNDVDINNQLYFVMEFNSGLSLEDDEQKTGFSLYPNPAQDYLFLKSGTVDLQMFNAIIYDMRGKVVKEIRSIQGTRIDISSLEKGSYSLLIEGKGSISFQKL